MAQTWSPSFDDSIGVRVRTLVGALFHHRLVINHCRNNVALPASAVREGAVASSGNNGKALLASPYGHVCRR